MFSLSYVSEAEEELFDGKKKQLTYLAYFWKIALMIDQIISAIV